MRLVFSIPGPLLPFAGQRASVPVEGAASTLGEALEDLWRECPGLRDRVLDERGRLRPHVNLFVGGESVRHLGGLRAALKEGDTIAIIPAVSGGSGRNA